MLGLQKDHIHEDCETDEGFVLTPSIQVGRVNGRIWSLYRCISPLFRSKTRPGKQLSSTSVLALFLNLLTFPLDLLLTPDLLYGHVG
jgi:hypothetical protein